jgi:hypothetical protein
MVTILVRDHGLQYLLAATVLAGMCCRSAAGCSSPALSTSAP